MQTRSRVLSITSPDVSSKTCSARKSDRRIARASSVLHARRPKFGRRLFYRHTGTGFFARPSYAAADICAKFAPFCKQKRASADAWEPYAAAGCCGRLKCAFPHVKPKKGRGRMRFFAFRLPPALPATYVPRGICRMGICAHMPRKRPECSGIHLSHMKNGAHVCSVNDFSSFSLSWRAFRL